MAVSLQQALNTLTDRIDGLNTDIESVLKAFVYVRDTCSEEEWDKWTSDPRLSILLDALSDLEYTLENED